MTEKQGRGGPTACKLGEIATIYEAPNGYTSFGASLLAAAITNHEHGLPGRCS